VANGYPEWLDFSEYAYNLRRSYYLPGKLKGEASLRRSIDGTMPPGAWPKDTGGLEPPAGDPVGLCDEAVIVFEQWITGDYREFPLP
jgi:hypothetical protein